MSLAGKRDEIGDRTVARFLASEALREIRATASRGRREPETRAAALERVWFLANLCDNLPLSDGPSFGGKPRHELTRPEQAMADREMSYAWNIAGSEGREWYLSRIARLGVPWTPPPPLPTPRKGPPALTWRERRSLLAGWPVLTPAGQTPLPRGSRMLKVVNTATLQRLHDGPSPRPRGDPWLSAHLDPAAEHYLHPDPGPYNWPTEQSPEWLCRALVRMSDGEQVTFATRTSPETFADLPSTLPRRRQRRLAVITRATERDLHHWKLEHEAVCGPGTCGYRPPEPEG